MRLLDVNTLTFSDFPSKIPKYVIASHRWVTGAEVMLTGMQAGTQTNSYGYRKVKGFAEYVKTNMPEINWLWIDTCCIDQKSSSELTEAINSMFRWYRNAEVCLAYLHDVPVAADMASFETSTWFRRGWTLQELLAPSVVVFLSQDWEVIGHKGRGGQSGTSMPAGPLINDRIAEITHIPGPILQDYGASRALSVEEKLQWMANRQTTREEDLSYCLLGILDVSMNIRYGDGLERTRERMYRKVQSRHYDSRAENYQGIQRGSTPGPGFTVASSNRPIVGPETSSLETGSENDMASIRRWLSPPPRDSVNGKKQLRDRTPGSCKWITQTSTYREWLSNSPPYDVGKVFWIHGPAGLGKSVLNADMVNDLVTRDKQFVASYFASSRNIGYPESILRSWLEQCAEVDPVARAIVLALVPQGRPSATVSSAELWKALKSVASAAGRRIFALDGLDQFPPKFDLRKAFLERLLETFATGQARVLISSRAERDLRSTFYPESVTDVRPTILEHRVTPLDLQADVTALTKTIFQQKFPALPQEERHSLTTHVVQRSDGMFSWLKFLESRLSSEQSADEVRNAIDNTVSELDEEYHQKLQSIGFESHDLRDSAGKALAWLMYASTQINSHGLRKALDTPLDGYKPPSDAFDRIMSLFDGLLQEQPNDKTDPTQMTNIDFVHSSLRHCLATRPHELEPDDSLSWILTERDAHLYLTRFCVNQLSRAESSEWSEVADVKPQAHLLRYAAEFWHVHASGLPQQDVDLCALFEGFLSSASPQFVAWSTFFESCTEYYEDWQTRPADTPSPLYYAARLNLAQVPLSFKGKWISTINQVGGAYGTALQSACAKAHTQVFELLMEWNADVNVKAGRHGTAIHAAAANGNENIVAALVAKDADLLVQNNAGCTPLHTASEWGNASIIDLLAKKGAAISTVNNDGWTPLHEAANCGHQEVARLLADKGAEISAVSKDDWTPLALASIRGHVEIAKILISRGAGISISDNYGRSPLFLASKDGQLEMVKFLASKGADISTANDTGMNAITQASGEGHLDIVMFLVSQGANVSASAKDGTSPLTYASIKGHVEVVKFLVEKGADISARDGRGHTPLHAASFNGQLKVVEFLVGKGADMSAESNPASNTASNPLLSACGAGKLEVAKFLVNSGADIEAVDANGLTPLYSASFNGHVEVVKFLTSVGASISKPSNKGFDPLAAAAHSGHLEVVKYLVERGATLSAPENSNHTLLNSAVLGGHLDVVEFLITKGADLTATDSRGWTPLQTAADKGRVDLVKVLMRSGASIVAFDNNGRIPVKVAIEKDHRDVADHLESPEVFELTRRFRDRPRSFQISPDVFELPGSEVGQKEPSKGSSMSWKNLKHKVRQMGKQ